MKRTRISLIILLAFLISFGGYSQERARILVQDFEVLIGNWQGSLTYLDYTSGKPYTMPADLEIKRVPNTNTFIFSNLYPNEKSANSADTIAISTDQNKIGSALVKSIKRSKEGEIEIITEETGIDGNDNKPATIKHTYLISRTSFVKSQDVKFKGEAVWINRHKYAYQVKK